MEKRTLYLKPDERILAAIKKVKADKEASIEEMKILIQTKNSVA